MNQADYKLSMNLQALCNGLAEVLQEQYGSPVGFVLILAPFNQHPRTEVQYVANVKREDGIDLIKELLRRWQQGEPDIPTHLKN